MRIEDLGPPDRIVAGFAPELYGTPLNDGDVLEQAVVPRGGLTYYQYLVKPHRWVDWVGFIHTCKGSVLSGGVCVCLLAGAPRVGLGASCPACSAAPRIRLIRPAPQRLLVLSGSSR